MKQTIPHEAAWLVASLCFYLAAAVLAARAGSRARSLSLLVSGLAVHLGLITYRWVLAGHPPIFGTYEATLAGSWVLALFVAASYPSNHGHYRASAVTALPLVVLTGLYGLLFNMQRIPLTISELSLWVDFHALFAWLAYGPLVLSFCLSAVYLWKNRGRGSVNGGDGDDRWPSSGVIDELAARYLEYGFIGHTLMFVTGCYYSSILHGTWWTWDPVETTSLVTWLMVAFSIHLRLFFNWNGKRMAWLTVLVFITVLFSYWGLIIMPAGATFHIFDLEFKFDH